MIVTLPHKIEKLIDKGIDYLDNLTASDPFRGWMESVNLILSVTNVTWTTSGTTSGNMRILANAPLDVYLRDNAFEDESVQVIRNTAAGNVTVTDSTGTDTLLINGTVITYKFNTVVGWIRGA